MTALEQIIRDDLSALAEDSERDMPGLDEALPAGAGAYRDDRPGAEARRSALLETRHLELAMMPMAFERAFVHRVSRAAAGAVGILAALTVGVTVADPFLARLAGILIPELNMTVAALGVGLSMLVAYVIAGWIAESVYERRVRGSVHTTGEVYSDLDALAKGPVAEARKLVADVDGWSIGLPLVAAAALLPLFSLLVLLYGPFWRIGPSLFIGEVSPNLIYIGLGVAVTVGLAISLARACQRERRVAERPLMIRVLGHWAMVPAGFLLGLIVLVVLGQAILALDTQGLLPSEGVREFMAIAGSIAIFTPLAWIALLIRRREHTRLGIDQ